jgi:CRISPR-associated endonuclease Csn1
MGVVYCMGSYQSGGSMSKYSIGIDIGISSVGWSIVDVEKKKIVDLGSRIFPSGNAAGNQDRRKFRGMRRLTRRHANRLSDLKKLLESIGFPNKPLKNIKGKKSVNPYELRVKGLTEKLTKEEITTALWHIVKRRGISYDLGDLEDDGTSGLTDYKSSINENRRLLKEGKTVGEIQFERLNGEGQVRGRSRQIKTDGGVTLLNVFPSSAYADEAFRILQTQQKFYPEITDEFIGLLCKYDSEDSNDNGLIARKREYFIGPGNEKSRTNYGIYKTDGRTLDNLFDELIGKDKYNNEKRASASSYTAQVYNLLNDLNNLTVPNTEDGKITMTTKEEIIETAKTTDKQFGLTQICNIIGAQKEEIKGFRIDKNETPIILTLKGYRKFLELLAEINVEASELPAEFFDKIADILTLNTEKAEIRKQLDQIDFEISDEIKGVVIKENKNLLVDGRAQWHSFSYTTLNVLNKELLNTTDEQMTILTRLGYEKPNNKKYEGLKNIPAKQITEEIYNPVVAKSTREAINVFNAIAKRVGRENIEHVVIELPRDDNEDDVKRNYAKFQKTQEDEKNNSNAEIMQQMNITEASLFAQYKRFKRLPQKVRFWYQQEGICPYCGEKIRAVQLINNNDSFEVDHIIPISVSFDDSQNNKVLVHSKCNQEKGQQTPLGWINNGGGFGITQTEYIAKVKANKRYSKNKTDNLLNNLNLDIIETRRGFIQRNINDTRYASKVVLNEFYSFFKSNNLPTKVKVVRGKWTSQMRKKWNSQGGLDKSRDTHHHHAIDASIIAAFPLLSAFDKAIELIDIDKSTGEILNDRDAIKKAQEDDLLEKWAVVKNKEFEKLVDEQLVSFPLFRQVELANNISSKDNPVKFSHKVDKKANRAVANQTIYGTRIRDTEVPKGGKTEIQKEEYIFGTIDNIYRVGADHGPDMGGYKLFKKILDKKNGETKFLMQAKDPETWKKVMKVLENYPDFEEKTQDDGDVKKVDISPFELYRRDNGFITKYSKRDNGPKVVSLKYYDAKLGNHIDITPTEASNHVVLQSLKPWRTDVYFNPDTQLYELLGLKYSDLKYTQGMYGITQDDYEKLKYGVDPDGEIAWKPISKNSEFRFSLYRNDRVRIINENAEEIELLFGSRTGNQEGYVEMKPISKSKFTDSEEIALYGKTSAGRFFKKLSLPYCKIYKVNTDILGKPYYTEKESDQPDLNVKI